LARSSSRWTVAARGKWCARRAGSPSIVARPLQYFIFTSFWNYKFYYVFGFLGLVFGILIVVTICVTIVATYFVLNSENYNWHWLSFLASSSTSGYVFLYSIYYYHFKTKMSGLLQATYYFGYMSVVCLALGLMCGALGVAGASAFTRKIYSSIKVD